MRKLCAVVLLFLFVSSAAATSIESETVTVDLESSQIEAEIVVDELTKSAFSYITAYNVKEVEGQINGEHLDCRVQELSIGTEILCETDKREGFTVNLNFKSDNLVTSREDVDIFRYTYSVYRPTDEYNFRVLLPSGAGLLDQGNVTTPVVSPDNYEIGSDGRQIYLEWSMDPDLGETLDFRVMYESLSSPMDYLRYGVLGFSVLVVAGTGYLAWKRRNRESIESVYGDLSTDKVEILEILKDNGGEMLQKDVVNESEYSKAKVSGVVSDLVDEDIIYKEKEGRSNKLAFSKKFSV